MTILHIALLAVAPHTLVIKGLDPIELAAGREVPGLENLSTTLGRHEYRFGTEANLARFKANPYRFAVQNGGACGKMGALSGHGSPDRWAVVDGKIFLFASEGCRTTFLSRKEAYVRTIEAVPPATRDERRRAEGLFSRMIEAHGGAKAIAKVKSLEWGYEIPYTEAGVKKTWNTRGAYLGPDRFANWEQWDAGLSFFVKDGRTAREGKRGATYEIHPGELRELTANTARSPVGLLLGGGGKPLKPGPTPSSFVMKREDVVFTVNLNPASLRIASIEYVDIASGPVASVTTEYSNYEKVEGVMLPRTSRTKADAGPWGKPSTLTSVVVNGPVPVVFDKSYW